MPPETLNAGRIDDSNRRTLCLDDDPSPRQKALASTLRFTSKAIIVAKSAVVNEFDMNCHVGAISVIYLLGGSAVDKI